MAMRQLLYSFSFKVIVGSIYVNAAERNLEPFCNVLLVEVSSSDHARDWRWSDIGTQTWHVRTRNISSVTPRDFPKFRDLTGVETP
jgi:hypothetical protein